MNRLLKKRSTIRSSLGAALLLVACGEGSPSEPSTTDSTGNQTSSPSPSVTGSTSGSMSVGPSVTSANGETATTPTTVSPNATTSMPSTSGSGETPPSNTSGSSGSEPDTETTGSLGEQSSEAATTDELVTGESSSGADTGVDPGLDPLNATAVCTSNSFWMRGENDRMRPGEACIACHTSEGEGPRYAIAGTLFPTGHEPDDCNGLPGDPGGLKVIITDANGQEHELSPNSVGNFFLSGNLATPYTAKVVSNAGERLMLTPQQDGDCNKCHTAEGTSGAPGRVVVPF